MTDKHCDALGNCGWAESQALMARTFEEWRSEFRSILEDHRRDIQSRLERIEREIEKKSDKENVDLLVRSINGELKRHADEISRLNNELDSKAGTDALWKAAGIVVTMGGILAGLIASVVNWLGR